MTSTLATNNVDPGLSVLHYLQSDRNGFPLQGQVPQTYETVTSAGPFAYPLFGNNNLLVNTTATGGQITVNMLNPVNLFGRVVQVVVLQTMANPLVFNFGTGNIHDVDNNTVASTFTAPITPAVYEFNFYGPNDCAVFEINAGGGGASTINYDRFVQYPLLVSNANNLNPTAKTYVQWNAASTLYNASPPVGFTFNNNATFTAGDTGPYQFSYWLKPIGNVDVSILATIDTYNGSTYTTWDQTQSSIGLDGLFFAGSVIVEMTANVTQIGVRVQNLSGATRAIIPTTQLEGICMFKKVYPAP